MTTMTLAKELVALCKEGKNLDAIRTLYAPDVVSYEVQDPMKEVRGLPGVIGKAEWWQANHTVHSAVIDGPWPNGDQFVVRYVYDITPKATGTRITMDEAALYTVKNGKVVEEKFFYGA